MAPALAGGFLTTRPLGSLVFQHFGQYVCKVSLCFCYLKFIELLECQIKDFSPIWGVVRRQWHPTSVLLPGKSHGWRSLVGCSPWVAKSRARLSDFTFTFHFHAWEKEMVTHSSILAWRVPGTEEPSGLLSMGSHRVGHD